MDDFELKKRVSAAENLRKKQGKIWGCFFKSDYYGSAELFLEIANDVEKSEDKELYYNEAAKTFLMEKGEYSYYRAAEAYKKIVDIYNQTDKAKAVEYLIKYASNLENADRFLIGGQAYMKIAEILAQVSVKEGILYYIRAYNTFARDGTCPCHMKEARQKCLALQLEARDLEGAIESLNSLCIKYSSLCKHILCILLKRTSDDDLESSIESEIVMALINKKGDERIEILERFMSDNFLPEYASVIFNMAIEASKPENDIC